MASSQIHSEILRLLDLPDDFNKEYAILDLQDRMGWTDYIDCLTISDMKDPIMIGKDKYSRPFIAFRVRVENGDYSKDEVSIIFRRLSNPDCNVYVNCGFFGDHLMNDTFWKCARDLLLNGFCEFQNKRVLVI